MRPLTLRMQSTINRALTTRDGIVYTGMAQARGLIQRGLAAMSDRPVVGNGAYVEVRRERPGLLRWSPPSDRHITLGFLGNVPEDIYPDLLDDLSYVATQYTPMRLSLRNPGQFDARVLWMGVHGDLDELRSLAVVIGEVAPVDEGYGFNAHMTLAKSDGSTDLTPLVKRLAGYSGPEWTADRLHLIRSRPGPDGAVYEPVASWPLEGRR